jgi:hypothetical protein
MNHNKHIVHQKQNMYPYQHTEFVLGLIFHF